MFNGGVKVFRFEVSFGQPRAAKLASVRPAC
jgi:hypothetical protein